jgi:hypothetical protein
VSNTISGTAYIGPSGCGPGVECDTASGILVFESGLNSVSGAGVSVNGNHVSQFDIGVAVQDSPKVTVVGNVLDGQRDTEENGCRPVVKGIDANFTSLLPAPTTVTIQNNTVSNVKLAADDHGCQTGLGIRSAAYSADGAPAVATTVTGNVVSDFQKNGITVNGQMNTAKITKNNVTGWGTQSDIAQNLIQLGFGAGGTVGGKFTSGNTLSNFGAYTGPSDDSSAGVLLYDVRVGVKVTGNTFREAAGLLDLNGASTQGGYTVLLFNDLGGTGPDVKGTKNDWGVYTATEIAQRIYDGNDDPSAGVVSFQPFLPPPGP